MQEYSAARNAKFRKVIDDHVTSNATRASTKSSRMRESHRQGPKTLRAISLPTEIFSMAIIGSTPRVAAVLIAR